jgi:hypothetical protein
LRWIGLLTPVKEREYSRSQAISACANLFGGAAEGTRRFAEASKFGLHWIYALAQAEAYAT